MFELRQLADLRWDRAVKVVFSQLKHTDTVVLIGVDAMPFSKRKVTQPVRVVDPIVAIR